MLIVNQGNNKYLKYINIYEKYNFMFIQNLIKLQSTILRLVLKKKLVKLTIEIPVIKNLGFKKKMNFILHVNKYQC